MCATSPTVLNRFLRNFTGVFGHSLKICMWFGYNPQTIFQLYNPQLSVYHLSSIFRLQCYQYLIDVVYVVPLGANTVKVYNSSL